MFGDEVDYVVWDCQLEPIELGLLLKNGNAVLEIGHTDVGDHSPLEPAD